MAPLSAPGTGRARGILVGNVIVMLLPYPVVALRLYARKLSKTSLMLNDYLVMAALLITTGLCIEDILSSILGGLGQAETMLTPSEVLFDGKISTAVTLSWLGAVCLVRMSVLHFYATVFRPDKSTVRVSYILMVFTLAHFVAGLIGTVLICRPFNYNWNKRIEGHCGNSIALFLWLGITSVLLDTSIVLTPQPAVWKLRLRLSRKIFLAIIFGIGAVIVAFSCVRCWAISEISSANFNTTIVFDNFMTLLEPTLGIINASLPLLMPVVKHLAKGRFFLRVQNLLSGSGSEDGGPLAQRRLPIGLLRRSGVKSSPSPSRGNSDVAESLEFQELPKRNNKTSATSEDSLRSPSL